MAKTALSPSRCCPVSATNCNISNSSPTSIPRQLRYLIIASRSSSRSSRVRDLGSTKATTPTSSTTARLFSSANLASSRALSAFALASARATAASSASGPAADVSSAVSKTSSHAKMTSSMANSYVFSHLPPATSRLDFLDLSGFRSLSSGTISLFSSPLRLNGFLAIPDAANLGRSSPRSTTSPVTSSSSSAASNEKSRKPSGRRSDSAAASRSGSLHRSNDSTPSHSCRHVAAR